MISLLGRLWRRLNKRCEPSRAPEVRFEDDAPPPHAIAERLNGFLHPNGRRRAEVWRRHDGFFGFGEEELLDDEYVGSYWSPVGGSGLYATHDEALHDAKAEIAWLRVP